MPNRGYAWVGVTAREWAATRSRLLARVADEVGYPVVVKPAREGSSFGVAFADDEAALVPALEAAL